jgi:hypothetical protein
MLDGRCGSAKLVQHLKQRPWVERLQLIEKRLEITPNTRHVTLEVAPGQSVTATRVRVEPRQTDFSWFGEIGQHGSAIFVVREGRVTGTVDSSDTTYQVTPIDPGCHVVAALRKSAFGVPRGLLGLLHTSCGTDPCEGPSQGNEPTAHRQSTSRSEPRANSSSEIDVIVAYTPAVERARRDVRSLIQLAVDELNQITRNSKVNATFRLSSVYETCYEESGNIGEILSRFHQRDDGHTDEVHAIGAGADLRVLLVDVPGYGNEGLTLSGQPSRERAFSLVNYEYATGFYTFAHEIGHLMGLAHGDGCSISKKLTVEAMYCHTPGYQRIQHWSNPRTDRRGAPLGTSGRHDSSSILSRAASEVARYRSPTSPAPPPPTCADGSEP